ncbi:MAG: hypothetical protein ACJ75P_07170 [Gaiellaceae bacterium]
MGEVADRLYQQEANDHVRRVLGDEIRSRTVGSRYFTFNVFNVPIDVNRNVVTIEDELDPALEESVSLEEFSARLGA